MGHKWWCDGRHARAVEYRGDVCIETSHVPPTFAAIAMPVASRDDLDAAALLLGYHPTHLVNLASNLCDLCATNVTGELGMTMCPQALPPEGTVIKAKVVHVEDVLVPKKPKVGAVYATMRVVNVKGSNAPWRVEERMSFRTGETYWYCPCPSWKYQGHFRCKHTDIARQEQ